MSQEKKLKNPDYLKKHEAHPGQACQNKKR